MLKKLFIKNMNIIFKFMICIGIIFFFPIIVSLAYGEYSYIYPFLGISLGLLAISIPIVLLTSRNSKKIFLSSSNGSILVFVIWLILILLSTIPFCVYNNLSYLKSLREATSSWTTTGITFFDYDNPDGFNTLIFWRSWMQFLGGLGIIFIGILFISTKNTSSLFISEGHSLKVFLSVKKTVIIIFSVYLIYLILGTIAYVIAGMSFFDAMIHSMSAISSGGFSSHKEGISYFNSAAVNVITCVIMIVGTINFSAQVILFSGKFKKFLNLTEIIWAFIFLLFGFILVLIYSCQLEGNYMSNVGNAYFNVISAITTTGYVSGPNLTGPSYLFLILIFMIIGNNSNSTSGGLKTYRIALWIKEIFRSSKKIFFESSLIKLRCYKTPSGKVFLDNIREINYYFSLYLLFMFVGVLILTASGVMSVENSFLNLIDCFSNTGMGLTNAAVADPHPLTIIVDCIAMIIGRLELTFILLVITSCAKIFQKNNHKQII